MSGSNTLEHYPPLLPAGAHRHLWLVSVTVIDGEENNLSHPDSTANSAVLDPEARTAVALLELNTILMKYV